jgi:hypothetical protein
MLMGQNFADLGGTGRADLVQVYPTTNEVTKPQAIPFMSREVSL